MDFLSAAAPVLVALGGLGGVAAIVQAFRGRGKDKADAAAVISSSATDLLEPMRAELTRLQESQQKQAEHQQQQAQEHEAALEKINRRVSELESTVRGYERREWALVRFIRALIDSHVRHAPEAPLPPTPTDLIDLI